MEISVSLPSDGTTGDVADYNTPINTIVNAINGNLDNTNIKSAAAIAGSKLADASIDIGTKASAWDGWIPVSDSWAYASASTITVPSDASTKYSVGDKIKLVQSGSTKYFYVTAVTATVLTVTGGSDYTVANVAISSIYYSKASTPFGFPGQFSYSPTLSGRFDNAEWTKDCKFTLVGKDCFFTVNLISADGAPMGGGVAGALFTLPITAAAIPGTDGRQQIGTAVITDDSSQTWNGAVLFSSTTVASIAYWNTSANLAAITSLLPFQWALSDEISVIARYQVA